ncbi:helix-turn-helix domain-containing protein [Flavobacterium sp. ZB4R12]|uniref:helix-turn-helix domain-containing protein n=1 Tax=Flavobacterium sp. ZB4R12 TaxID=3398732 RepID=UPI003AB07FB2
MPKKIKIEITESLEFLRNEHIKAKGELKKDRLKVLIYIKEGKYHFQSDIAKKLGRTEKTVREWIQEYSQSGLSSLLKVSSGGNNTRTISDKALELIAKKILDVETTITSYLELQLIIEKELGEKIAYGALYSHCKRKYKSKLKVARKSHHKKDEKAEELFKKP